MAIETNLAYLLAIVYSKETVFAVQWTIKFKGSYHLLDGV